jgi:glycosyltransferase involved in cell wall biosynthesis
MQLSDVDLSYLHEAQQMADITYILEVCPRFLNGPAFSIGKIYGKSGVFKATDIYPELGRLSDFIDTERFYVVNTCGRLWQLKSFWTHFLLLLFLMRHQFDVLHLVWPPNIYEFALYALRRKMLLTVHDPFPHSGLDTTIVRLRRKVAFWLIPRFIILNRAQRRDFLQFYHLPDEAVIDSQLSCYTYLQTIVPSLNMAPPSGSYVLFAGKISPYKGLDYLLPAMEKMHEKCPDCRLVVAGGGQFHFDISRYQALGYIDIRNRFIPDGELVALVKNCAFMVCPYTDATQSGVIMSAFALDKPVIATNVGGLPEMVKHRKYGLVVREKDVDALAEGMTELWTHPEMTRTFAENIRSDYYGGELSWKKTAAHLIETINKCQLCKKI